MAFLHRTLLGLLKFIGILYFVVACGGSTGNTPVDSEREGTYRTQQLSSTDREDDDEEDFSEDEAAPKPQIISGMYLTDVYLSCSKDSGITAPANHIAFGCLGIDEESGETFDINMDQSVSYSIASGSNSQNPSGSKIMVREDDEKENYEKRYWAFTAIAPLGQKTINVEFVNKKVGELTVEVEIQEKLGDEVKKAWENEGLVVPQGLAPKETSNKALHDGR